jgi:flavorubredoxin
MIKGLKFKGKSAAAFGSYGWSGKVVAGLTNELDKCGFKIVNDGHKSLWVPDNAEIEVLKEYGKDFVRAIQTIQ